MLLVFEISSDDNTFVGFTKDEAVAEAMIVEKFKELALVEDELVKIEYEGRPVYTIRRKPAVVADEFEYVDNEGNPINADGSDIIESDDIVMDDVAYEYDGDVLWTIREGEEDKPVGLSSSDYYLLSQGPNNPFERDENLAIITTA
jgi:hypothetical protein